MTEIVIRGKIISEDDCANLNLTDIWKAAGSPSTKTTSEWRRLPHSIEYMKAVAKNMGLSHVFTKKPSNSIGYIRRGRKGGTFAHVFIAIAYAEYLAPDLAVEVKRTYHRVRTGDLTLVDEILEKADAARHHNEVRDISKQIRKQYTDTLTSHGAGGGAIGYCTDAIYQVLLNGTAQQIRSDKNLPAKANIRDTLPTGELLQTMNTEYLSSERIEALDIKGKEPCAEASRKVAKFVKTNFEKATQNDELGEH